MRTAAVTMLGVVLVAAPPRGARADDGGYGERILAIDGTSDALIIAGLFADNEWVSYAGLAGHVVGGPLVHLAHGNTARAGLSLGTRVAAPLLGALLGQAICVDDTGFLRCIGSAAVGLAVGMVAAQIVDPLLIVPDAEPAPAALTFRF